VLTGRIRRGVDFFFLVLTLAALSVLFFSGLAGQILFGLAVAVHAYSIFDLTPWRDAPSARERILGMGTIMTVLLAAYWPVVSFLSERLIPRRYITYYRGRALDDFVLPTLGQVLWISLGISLAIAAAFQLQRWWTSRKHKEGA
jgi:hypothetical protein